MDLLADLGWLRRAPADLRDRCKALSTHLDDPDLDTDLALVDLATYSLDGNQLDRLARLVARRRQSPTDTILARFRLGILGSGTLSLIAPAVAGSGPRHLTLIEVVEGNYDRALEDAMDPGSPVRAGALDGVLLALDYRKLGLDSAIADPKLAAEAVEAAFQYVQTIAESLRASVKGPLLVQTVVPPLEPLFGSLDAAEPGSPRAMVAALNRKLAAWVGPSSDALVDAAALANAIGLQRWHDPLQWHSAKLPFAQDLVPLYADLVARTVAALRGKTRKCLVLDLDNTLWGGVIGDDGLEGIALGNGSATGEAFLAIQRMALEYRKRGIVLAVCSKNEEDAARLPFCSHPDMWLREEHISVFQANWTDKASNLRAIAETLNVGMYELVFLANNPLHRSQVRR